jgi:trimethylamine--corrinoid protein Co-methyltransferase
MKTARFEVLSQQEIERIHAASMEILSQVGIKVDHGKARELFGQAGAQVDEGTQAVRIPERLVQWALQQAPSSFILHGNDPDFQVEIGGENVCFAGLGTPTHILDIETGERREVTLADLHRHLQIINGLDHIHNSQMDIWPSDIPMPRSTPRRSWPGRGTAASPSAWAATASCPRWT